MGAYAADLNSCVTPCAVIQFILRQCTDNRDDNSKDDCNEDDHKKTGWAPAAEEVRIWWFIQNWLNSDFFLKWIDKKSEF